MSVFTFGCVSSNDVVHDHLSWRLIVRKSKQDVDVQSLCSNRNTPCAGSRVRTSTTSMMAKSSSKNSDNVFDKIARALGIDQSLQQPPLTTSSTSKNDPKQNKGKVIRTAARPHQTSGGSIPLPSSRLGYYLFI